MVALLIFLALAVSPAHAQSLDDVAAKLRAAEADEHPAGRPNEGPDGNLDGTGRAAPEARFDPGTGAEGGQR